MTIFIGFGHRKRVGKDTAARFLCSYLRINKKNSNVEHIGFSDKLKDVCYQLYSWAGVRPGWYYEQKEHEHEKDTILPTLNRSPRQIWIDFGTLVAREVYPDTWLQFVFKGSTADICIVKDMRFPNEANGILDNGGYVYRIDRPDMPHTSDIADDPLINYDRWSGILVNDGTLADFNKKIEELAKELLLKINQ
jgi:hypothetical protein